MVWVVRDFKVRFGLLVFREVRQWGGSVSFFKEILIKARQFQRLEFGFMERLSRVFRPFFSSWLYKEFEEFLLRNFGRIFRKWGVEVLGKEFEKGI